MGPLFEIRIALAEVVAEAVALELQALGGKAYLAGPGRGFARRSREAAFIPVITPSLVQLKTALAKRREQGGMTSPALVADGISLRYPGAERRVSGRLFAQPRRG